MAAAQRIVLTRHYIWKSGSVQLLCACSLAFIPVALPLVPVEYEGNTLESGQANVIVFLAVGFGAITFGVVSRLQVCRLTLWSMKAKTSEPSQANNLFIFPG